MLSAAQVWESLVNKDPRLKDDNATIEFKASSLRALLRQVHGQGEACGRDIGKAEGITEQQRKQQNASSNPLSGLGDIFGGGA